MRIVSINFSIKIFAVYFPLFFVCFQTSLRGMLSTNEVADPSTSLCDVRRAGADSLLRLSQRMPRRAIALSSPKAPFSPLTGFAEASCCAGDMPSFELPAAKGVPEVRRYSVDDASSVGTAASCVGEGWGEGLRSPVELTRRLAVGDAESIEPHIPKEEELGEDSIAAGGFFGVRAFKKLELSKPLFKERLPFLRRFIDECMAQRAAWSETLRKIKNSDEYLAGEHVDLESSKKHLAYWTGFQIMLMARLYEFGPKTKVDAAEWVALGHKDGADMYNPELYDELLKYVRNALNHYESIISRAGASASSVSERCVIMRTYWKAFKDAVCLAALGVAS